jgi:glycosyltransferase involved in cell wall biosynthesis
MLTVLSVGYPFAPICADPAGGAEQVLAHLDRGLTAAGHRSIVVAPARSDVKQELRPIAVPTGEITVPTGEITEPIKAQVHAVMRQAVADVLREVRVDLIHYHGVDFAAYVADTDVPQLATLHLPIAWYPDATFRAGVALVPVSASQARTAPPGLRLLDPIPNGVDLDRFTPAQAEAEHALILGRVAPEKGFHDALTASRRAGIPLIAAGELYPYPEHQRYFEERVRPRLDARRRFVGPVAGAEKRRLLAEARCLLAPFTAPETSSLVAMEALASGTPVIAYRSGALPDMVEDGITGFVVDNADGMAEAIGRIDAIDPAACRAAAEARFDVQATVRAYLDLYAWLAA